MKTTIHLARHGEVHNPKGIFYGRIPGYKLSEKGREQAKKLGKHLSKKPISAIYASPLDRTRETAALAAEFFPNIPISYDERLIEVRSPKEGILLDEMKPSNFNFYIEEDIRIGGESLEDIWKRMNEAMTELRQKHEGEEILLFSHGDPIMLARAIHSGKPLTFESIRGEYYIPTAHGVQFVFEEERVMVEDITPV